jgi:hypothetical protein
MQGFGKPTSAKYSAICCVYARYAFRRALDILASSREREVCTWLLNSRWPGSAAPRRTELRLPRCDRLPDTVAGAAGLSTQEVEQLVCCVLGLQLRSSSSSDSAEDSSGIAAYMCTRTVSNVAEVQTGTNDSASAMREPTTLRLRSKVFSTGC